MCLPLIISLFNTQTFVKGDPMLNGKLHVWFSLVGCTASLFQAAPNLLWGPYFLARHGYHAVGILTGLHYSHVRR
jgi:hypothetical protein